MSQPPPRDPGARLAELRSGCQALGLDLTDDQIDRLRQYGQLIERWTQVYNLTAVRDAGGILIQHLLDSLAALPPLKRHLASADVATLARLLDVGSGAGLPGLALAVAAPELAVTCVDTVAKKAGFMRQVIAELKLTQATALHARVEALPASAPWDVITSRAFSSLADFVRLTEPLLARQGVWMAMKGRLPTDEIAALPESVEVFHVEPLQVPGLDAERCLVWMRRRG